MSEQIFAVSGMHCNSCVMGVTEALTALDPVQEVTVDLDPEGASTVRVFSDSALSVEEVRETLVRAGGDFAVAAG
ncbi:heavy-metal-associated domain-containing protein [Mycobacteroides salmoniphilum]|uniref:heavy-metal-associated domain-containing protein n=1 Tax=Mycobacteroides salmoniphilum TaxID=404941 RepID=UPI0009920909|nr:heavy metal-associated domain-containing protein [Mycobacteroides salmoniphilum]